eukprot:2761206-Alexandrium_andersonii.AAC.1
MSWANMAVLTFNLGFSQANTETLSMLLNAHLSCRARCKGQTLHATHDLLSIAKHGGGWPVQNAVPELYKSFPGGLLPLCVLK